VTLALAKVIAKRCTSLVGKNSFARVAENPSPGVENLTNAFITNKLADLRRRLLVADLGMKLLEMGRDERRGEAVKYNIAQLALHTFQAIDVVNTLEKLVNTDGGRFRLR
jgi:hypothetical protein